MAVSIPVEARVGLRTDADDVADLDVVLDLRPDTDSDADNLVTDDTRVIGCALDK